jgi:hypothetical protein
VTNRLKEMGETASWRLMVGAALRGAERSGFALTRQPGRGLSNTWQLEKQGEAYVAAVRTTRDRWIAFPPLEGGNKWKTLDNVEKVLVAAVDDPANPQNVDVYLFPAEEVRKRFNASYAARIKAGHTVRDNYGMWVRLDTGDPQVPSQIGAGLADAYPTIARFSLDELEAASAGPVPPTDELVPAEVESDRASVTSVSDVLAQARSQIAQLTGIRLEAVKLDLKIEA